MDREIEFRAKDLKGNWVFGFYSPRIWFPSFEQTPSIKTIKGSDVEININTLGQYTGLKDKNGTKVFESDIIRMHYFFENYDPSSLGAFEDEAEIIGVVKYDLIDGFYVETVDDHSRCYLQWIEEPTEELEVLGNIYDNPEWLEGENNEI